MIFGSFILVSEMDIEAIIEFSQRYPWKPQYPASLVRRFLTELISTRELVFDLHDELGRISTAVLLDKVNNPANDACLEILGMRPDANAELMMKEFINKALKNAPLNRSGFQVGLPESSPLNGKFLKELGLQSYYETYEMSVELTKTSYEKSSEIRSAVIEDCNQVYEALCKSFAHNRDTSIPEASTWKPNFLKSSQSYFFVWVNGNSILGFANLIQDESETLEVRTIGVLPSARGLGLGYKLLNHCLQKARELGAKSCHLSVAVANEKALGIYLRSGFKTIEKFKCYRMNFNKA